MIQSRQRQICGFAVANLVSVTPAGPIAIAPDIIQWGPSVRRSADRLEAVDDFVVSIDGVVRFEPPAVFNVGVSPIKIQIHSAERIALGASGRGLKPRDLCSVAMNASIGLWPMN